MVHHVGTRSLSAFGLAAILATAGIVGYHYSGAQGTEALVHSCGVIQAGPQVGSTYYLAPADFDTLVNCFVGFRTGGTLLEVDAHGVDTHSTTVFESAGAAVRADQRFVGDYGPPTQTSTRCRSIGIVPAGAVEFDCGAVQMTFMVNPVDIQIRAV